MYCQICGTEQGIKFRKRSGLVLCTQCHNITPKKVSQKKFDKLYWGKDFNTIDESTRRSFYSDYRMSVCQSVEEYIRVTTGLAS